MTKDICPREKIEKLLLSTDGSEFSEGAIQESINLAKRCSSRLYIVSVVETNPEYQALAPQLVEKAEKETKHHLDSVKARAEKEGVTCEILVHQGEQPYQFIVDEASKNKPDMIIMGRRGRTGITRLLMGSVTARVIGHAPCNVLVVPKAAITEYKNILFATDGSKYSDAAAGEAICIAKTCGSSITALSVAGSPSEAILEVAKQKNADLIVVGSHGRTGIERLLMGSVTERVIGNAASSVLVVKS
jgi:nucleotide-binding universal stress UspA family protein